MRIIDIIESMTEEKLDTICEKYEHYSRSKAYKIKILLKEVCKEDYCKRLEEDCILHIYKMPLVDVNEETLEVSVSKEHIYRACRFPANLFDDYISYVYHLEIEKEKERERGDEYDMFVEDLRREAAPCEGESIIDLDPREAARIKLSCFAETNLSSDEIIFAFLETYTLLGETYKSIVYRLSEEMTYFEAAWYKFGDLLSDEEYNAELYYPKDSKVLQHYDEVWDKCRELENIIAKRQWDQWLNWERARITNEMLLVFGV